MSSTQRTVSGLALVFGLTTVAFVVLPLVWGERTVDDSRFEISAPPVASNEPSRSIPFIPSPGAPTDEFVLGGPAWSVDVVGDVAYVGLGAHLVAFDVSGPGDPVAIGMSPPLPGNVREVVVRDDIAFAAVQQITGLEDSPGGLFTLDVRDPSAISVLGHGAIDGGAEQVALDGDRAVLLGTWWWRYGERAGTPYMGVTVFDIPDPREPTLALSVDVEGERGLRAGVAVVSETAYLCRERVGLSILDLRSEAEPRIIAEGISPCALPIVSPDGETLVTVSETDDESAAILQMYDLAVPHEPSALGELLLTAPRLEEGEIEIRDVAVDWPRIMVTGSEYAPGGFLVEADLSDPKAPTARELEHSPWPALGVGAHGSRMLQVGVSTRTGELSDALDYLEFREGSMLASEISVIERRSDGSFERIGSQWGPGTLLSLAAAHDGMLYAFELDPRRDRNGLLWAIDITEGVPKYHTPYVLEGLVEDADDLFHLAPDALAASDAGLFVAAEGVHHFRVIDGRVSLVETIDGGVVVAADGDVSEPKDIGVTGAHFAPAALRSRRTDYYDDHSRRGGSVRLISDGGLILGSMIEGGVFGIRP